MTPSGFANNTQKYLDRYAEPEARAATRLPAGFSHVVVVPAFREGPNLLRGLSPVLSSERRVLLIVVVNAAVDCDPAAQAETGRLARQLLQGKHPRLIQSSPPILFSEWDGHGLVVIDRTLEFGLPAKQGVGLARRIGTDLALALRAAKKVESPWIGCTDADAVLPKDYFDALDGLREGIGAALFPFRHLVSGDPILDQATEFYELHLRYHTLGLDWAGSAYAFSAVGSSLAVHSDAYAAVRGFPKRKAGEDFYLLDKICKLAPLVRLAAPEIGIQSRFSDRVPFGTGPSVLRIARALERGEPLTLLHPTCFAVLRAWLRLLNEFAEHRSLARLEQAADALDANLRPAIRAQLTAPDLRAELLRAAEKYTQPAIFQRRLREWFDGLRTLRLLHRARDDHFGTPCWREALALSDFAKTKAHSVGEALQALRDRERDLPVLIGPSARKQRTTGARFVAWP